jgi:HSP20 family molecular chaperone IbpA
VFQQGEDLLAIIELPGIDKNDMQIQAKGPRRNNRIERKESGGG